MKVAVYIKVYKKEKCTFFHGLNESGEHVCGREEDMGTFMRSREMEADEVATIKQENKVNKVLCSECYRAGAFTERMHT